MAHQLPALDYLEIAFDLGRERKRERLSFVLVLLKTQPCLRSE
jgi:hypothetical protein